MVAVVNGYVCFTTCDAKAARQGKDPLAISGGSQDDNNKKKNGLDNQPATVLGGALKAFKDALDPTKQSDPSNPASGQSPPGNTSSSSRVDVTA